MRCSIHALNIIMGSSDPDLCPNPTNFDKFVQEIVSHLRRQLGYVTDTRRMIVTIPDSLLGMLVSFCQVCPWGMFLFVNLHQAIYQMLDKNAQRLMLSPEFRELIKQCEGTAGHPTEAACFHFFSSKVTKAIWNCKARSFITTDMHTTKNGRTLASQEGEGSCSTFSSGGYWSGHKKLQPARCNF